MLTLFYDNRCPICLRTKAVLERIDFGRQLAFIGIRNKDIFNTFASLDEAKVLQRMASLHITKSFTALHRYSVSYVLCLYYVFLFRFFFFCY